MESSEWPAVWPVRSQVHALLGNCLLKPPSEQTAVIVDPSFWEGFPVTPANDAMERGLDGLARASSALSSEGAHGALASLGAEYTRLFIGPGTPKAPLWESFYTGGGTVLFGESTFDVRRAFRQRGLELDPAAHQLEDHLGAELLYLAASGKKFSAESSPRNSVADDLLFLNRHPLRWIDLCRNAVCDFDRTGFYAGLLDLTHGFLLWDCDLLQEFLAQETAPASPVQ